MTFNVTGYPAYIYRAPGITSNKQARNIYNTYRVVVIIDDGLPETEQLPKFLSPEKGMPAVVIKTYTDSNLHFAEPATPGTYEFGGRYIFSIHPDFSRLSAYPIPLHDLPKTQTQNTKHE